MAVQKKTLWTLAKLLEGVGLVVVLSGVFLSMSRGAQGEGLASMAAEYQGLLAGGGLFLVGVLIERFAGTR